MFEDLLARIAVELKKTDLPYMIIGGQAVLLYGTPRMTKDIDITLGVDIRCLESLLPALGAMGLEIIPKDFRSFAEKTSVLPTKACLSLPIIMRKRRRMKTMSRVR